MKRFLLSLLLVLTGLILFSQPITKTTYLVIRFEESTEDNLFKKKFVIIDAESGNPYARDIYSLQFYNTLRKDNGFSFYDITKDSTPAINLYNYFQNTTQALSFLSGKGWELVSVIPEISSSYTYERDPNGKLVLVPNTISKPVYYLKKITSSN